MSIFKIFGEADTTIYSRYPDKNTGLDEILEISVLNDNDPKNNKPYSEPIPIIEDDIRRALIRFSDSDLLKIQNLSSGSRKVYFKAYIANAKNLSKEYSLEFRPLISNWEMGTGHVSDFPITRNGASWYQSGSYIPTNIGSPIINWGLNTPNESSYYLTSGGGTWNSSLYVTQSFTYQSSKDIEVDITPIYNYWMSGSDNNGIIIKHQSSIENNSGSYLELSYFSNDTHTIYPPTLEMRWDDSVYNTGSLQVIQNSDSVISIANNMGSYKHSSNIVKMRINSRDKYPTRVFTTSSWYTTNKALPQNSYWSILDYKTNDIVFDFDYDYTKISCDPTSSYFNLYMNGLEPERFYKILIKTNLPDGEIIDWDSDLIFKITK